MDANRVEQAKKFGATDGVNSGDALGFSVGGAKDVANFRANIERGFLPQPTDLTYEGLYYDYFFDTGRGQACAELFCPSYTTAVSRDPFSGEPQYFLTVGLNSNLDASTFHRKKLNLVVVLDISGSMGARFDRYYYDGHPRGAAEQSQDELHSKIEVAERSINALIDHLKPDDRFGLVLFDDEAYLARSLRGLGETDLQALKAHILEIRERGGTNFEAGMLAGTDQFNQVDLQGSDYDNRIVFMTDAMPNLGELSDSGLLGRARANAERRIWSTFVGMGVDFNSSLVESISKTRGANYYSVHSAADFKRRLDTEFEFMVTPMVFDLSLNLESNGYQIAAVYGSPEADLSTGTLMKVATLFPSRSENGQTKGGVVLLKLRRVGEDPRLSLRVSYQERDGRQGRSQSAIAFGAAQHDQWSNSGIRKAVLLARYGDLLRHWMRDTRAGLSPTVTRQGGIPSAPVEKPTGEGWERGSTRLSVSTEYAELFRDFAVHFQAESEAIGDSTLEQEAKVLAGLSAPVKLAQLRPNSFDE